MFIASQKKDRGLGEYASKNAWPATPTNEVADRVLEMLARPPATGNVSKIPSQATGLTNRITNLVEV
jgi:hypothetical protein